MTHTKKSEKVTIWDVAAAAGVSKSTVSLVLTQSDKVSDKSKQRVLGAIEQLGYIYNREAAALRSKRSNLVALVINDLTDPYTAQLAVELESHIYALGLVPMLVSTNESLERQQQIVNRFKEYNVCAFIMCPAPNTDRKWQEQLIDTGFPVVNIMREVDYCSAPCILPDNKKGAHLATCHLLEQGLRELAFIGSTATTSEHRERLAGFNSALRAHNITHPVPVIAAPANRQGGYDAFEQLMQNAPDTKAVVCFSDVVAYGAIYAMRQRGIAPGKDIKIVGFGDLEDSRLMQPLLSSVRIDSHEIAKRTGQALSELLEQSQPAVRTLVDVSLQLRESSL
ncbi:LacI family DNA-binding transcriptional regulator [Pseudoalteromonas sp. MMG022]|uniref:LacI family DNA-binding transcriptional regulator n=1 Tax=Pseudoalteromonas sp. MMG022 TaxID=2909978 RepID=UPI001F2251E1|nr:LacI family DNA-binding transcriptional regulator [Pseudoalteromonas sp. MMG022]MCF6436643.1 LacI family transcriptional regulator [Pseudoalteromonas sp. MMG022]